jgi:2Fe-2S ferredoxin
MNKKSRQLPGLFIWAKPNLLCIVTFVPPKMGKIIFKFEIKDIPPVEAEIFEGESILDVALDSNVNLHHNCGAVCGCSTCHVYVEQGEDFFPEMSDREEEYVDRARNPKYNSRLACQCKLQEDGDIVVTIPDQSVIIGH